MRPSQPYRDAIGNRQAVQARAAASAPWLPAWPRTLSRLDHDIRRGGDGLEFERDRAAAMHFFDLCETEIHDNFRHLYENADATMLLAATAAIRHNDTLPNELFAIPERSPVAAGTG